VSRRVSKDRIDDTGDCPVAGTEFKNGRIVRNVSKSNVLFISFEHVVIHDVSIFVNVRDTVYEPKDGASNILQEYTYELVRVSVNLVEIFSIEPINVRHFIVVAYDDRLFATESTYIF
jgi:hypothetical protein